MLLEPGAELLQFRLWRLLGLRIRHSKLAPGVLGQPVVFVYEAI